MIANAYMANHEHRADIAHRFRVDEHLVSRIVARQSNAHREDLFSEIA